MEILLEPDVNATQIICWIHDTCVQRLSIELQWTSPEQILSDLKMAGGQEIQMPAFLWREIPGLPSLATDQIPNDDATMPVHPMASLMIYEQPLRLIIATAESGRQVQITTRRTALERTEQLYRIQRAQRITPLKRSEATADPDAMELVTEDKLDYTERKTKRKRC